MRECEQLAKIEEAETRLRGLRREVRSLQMQVARALQDLRALRAPTERGCRAILGFAETQGFGVVEAADLIHMASAASRDTRVEPYVIEGRIPLRSASALDRALRLPKPPPLPDGTPAPTRDWVELATQLPSERFRDEVSAAASRTLPVPPSRLTAYLAEDDSRSFRRAKRLVMRNERRVVTDGEAIGAISRHYAMKYDRRYRRVMRRRATRGPSLRPGVRSRHVPADVRREIAERDADLCRVGLCPDEAFMDDGHLVAFAEGGSQTIRNLVRECHGHNVMQQRGWVRVVETVLGPLFVDRHGFVIERERRPDRPRRRVEDYLRDHQAPSGGPSPPSPAPPA